jgi:hypothetical protein
MYNVIKRARKTSGTVEAIDFRAPLGSLTPSEKLVVDKLGHLVREAGKLEEIFKIFDANESGDIDYGEWVRGLEDQNIECTSEEASKLFKVWDLDGNGLLDFQEFSHGITFYVNKSEGALTRKTDRRSSKWMKVAVAANKGKSDQELMEWQKQAAMAMRDLGKPSKDGTTDFKTQGNPEFYTLPALKQRDTLRNDGFVNEAIQAFWSCIDMTKNHEGELARESYIHFNAKLHLALVEQVTDSEIREAAVRDWEEDTNGKVRRKDLSV